MHDFYREAIIHLLRLGVLSTDMAILVVCGGRTDKAVLQLLGFGNVVISNVDRRPDEAEFEPYTWSYQDAENLTYPDESFDFCIVHSGLHHCYSPHRGMLEMYRVSRRGLLIIEPYDNLVTRVGVRLHVGQEYEHAAVYFNDGQYGGVGNGPIPNYVYRWTRHEIEKTVNTFAPQARHDVRFIHKMRIPWGQLRHRRNKAFYYAVRLAQPLLTVIERLFPKQCNNFAAIIRKPDLPSALHPWLRQDGESIHLNKEWLAGRYGR